MTEYPVNPPIPIPDSAEHVAIVGSRGYPDLEKVRSYVHTLDVGSVVISGGALGVDMTAEGSARASGLVVVSYRPTKPDLGAEASFGPWGILRKTFQSGLPVKTVFLDDRFSSFGRAAFFRNGLIVNACSRLVAFWDGQSPGTRNSIMLARDAGRHVDIYR